MLPFHWGLLGAALLIAFTQGASINSAVHEYNTNKLRRSKRSYKRGQTQSQYLNFGQPELDGKADAEATESGSRSSVSGTHGMGQAQSQFSSGDCSGCGVGGPVYEYPTGSPDPLTLGGNVVSYSDGKPSSIIGLPKTTPDKTFGPGAGTGSTFSPETIRQVGRPGGAGRDFGPGAGGIVTPGASGVYAPGTGGQVGRPGGDFVPGVGGTYGPGPGSTFTPGTGTDYMPGAGVGRQIGAPGTSFSPSYGLPASSGGNIGQQGIPSAGLAPGQSGGRNGYAPGTSVAGAPGTGGTFPPGTVGAGQMGTPGTAFAPSYGPVSSSGGVGQHGSAAGIGQPGVRTDFAPGSGISGGPRTGGTFVPGTGGAGQSAAPGTSYVPSYGPESGNGGIGIQGAPRMGVAPGQFGHPGVGGTLDTGRTFVPGMADGGQTGAAGVGKPGIGGIGQQGQVQPQRSQFIAPPAAQPGQVQGQQPRTGFGGQVPPFSHGPGQQMPSYIPGASYTQPEAGKQQYGIGGQQVPTYGTDGRRPTGVTSQPGQHTPLYGSPGQQGIIRPGQHISGQPITPGGSPYRPSSAPGQQQAPQYGTNQQITGYPQQPVYRPGYEGPTNRGDGSPPGVAVRPDTQYPGSSPQQILQGPGAQTISRPGFGGIQQGVGGGNGQTAVGIPSVDVGHQPGSGFQPDYRGYGLPGTGIQSGPEANYQPRASMFSQPGAGVQPGSSIQPGVSYSQPSSGIQPGITYAQPGTAAGVSNGVGVGQQTHTSGVQPGSWPFAPQGEKPGAATQPTHPGPQQGSGYYPGYGPQGATVQPESRTGFDQRPQIGHQDGGGYPQGATYAQPGSDTQHSARPMPGFVQPGAGIQTGLQQPNQQGMIVQPGSSQGQVGGISGVGQQTGAQPGAGIGQQPRASYSQPGVGFAPMPAGGVQQGQGAYDQRGSGIGTGYDTTYGQPGVGYRQPNAATQYDQRGYGAQGTGSETRPTGGTGSQFPGAGVTQYGPQQIVQPGSAYIPGVAQPSTVQQGIAGGGSAGAVGGAEDAFSQAESSIGNGQAAASAQGKKNGGTAKTQVQGTYSSSGSFSASAMTSDNDRSASSQVTGGVEGAMSQSQGQGGAAQSQAQVQVNEKTGGTKASSQSGGIIHQSQSEVQANDKGGLADAQSSGPGQTSSQAQIGFRPGQDGEIVRSAGGGQASAQSGAHSGNSQSQIQGTSKFGVSYHGAAQSASGTKEQVATYREQNRDLFNTISQFGSTDAVTDRVDTVYNPSLTSESDIPDLQLKASRTNKEVTNSNKLDDDSALLNEDEEEEPYDEYEDEEDYYNENLIKMESKTDDDKKLESSSAQRTHTQKSPTQTQQIAVADPTKKYNVIQNQDGRIQTYSSRTTTEIVPSGFRGTVNVEKKFHTKSLEPHKSENKLNTTAEEKSEYKPRTPDSFVTVTKSITGSMDNSKNPPQDNKNFQSTFYTKSSTCGYFTFSCNIVYGANGRSKICRPKPPTNGKC